MEGCRIDRHNESPSAIPQQKERVIPPAPPRRRTAGRARKTGSAPTAGKVVKKALSALEIRGDLLVQLLGGEGAAKDLAIDEKGRCGIDVELLRGTRALSHKALLQLVIRKALIERLLREARLLGDREHRLQRFLHHPILLLCEERVDQRKIFVLAGAAREHRGGKSERIERKFPEDEAHLSGVDVFLLHLGICGLVEMAAVGAGHRGIFDDGDGGIRLALDLIAERTRYEQVGQGDLSTGTGLRRGRIGRVPELIAAARKDRDERSRADEHIAAGDRKAGVGLSGHVASVSLAGFRPSRIRSLSRNVASAGRRAKAVVSRLFDGRSQPAERSAQVFVSDRAEMRCDACRRLMIDWSLRRLLATPERRLPQSQRADGTPAE